MEGDVATVNDTVSHTGAFLSMGLMTNFLSLKEIFLISLQGKPIFGVSLQKKNGVWFFIILWCTGNVTDVSMLKIQNRRKLIAY